MTYMGQACKRKGVKPARHGIIYQVNKKPRQAAQGANLGYQPIRMRVTAEGETLAKESRVNYAKLVTVEHNVKVYFIGQILPGDFDSIVRPAVDDCWSAKRIGRSRR
ncbi:hypothetical protein GE09DRAFT_1224722 [Coniochaeta sp. 2T2.1]|nr:hypothetical protein GE09DRAFT_1224722 [Coniochaeta sp. 2T2.1]